MLAELAANVRREIAAQDPAIVNRSLRDMTARAQKCIIAAGANFE